MGRVVNDILDGLPYQPLHPTGSRESGEQTTILCWIGVN